MNNKTLNSRSADVRRKTKETDVRVKLSLDGTGRSKISIGVPFLEHMLELFAKHGLFDLQVNCKGDLEIDDPQQVVVAELVEDDDLVEAVDEFGCEGLLDL